MIDFRHALNRVWDQFRLDGITDDVVIIQALGSALLGQLSPKLGVRPGAKRPEEIESQIRSLAQQADGPGTLFNRFILFQLSSILPGGRYPTPRHIVDFMYAIADCNSRHKLADFSCGSGGFLVRHLLAGGKGLYGSDLSPEWIKIADMNLRLRNASSEGRIEVRNIADHLCSDPDSTTGMFDRILMNPAFGERVDPALLSNIKNIKEVGTRSEIVSLFTCLKYLQPAGTAAVLVSPNVLFGSGRAERAIRHRLAYECSFRAIISLPTDGMQPFSPVQSTILLFDKASPETSQDLWVLAAEDDGYAAGRSRDLMKEPEPSSDLPVINSLLHSFQAKRDILEIRATKLGEDGFALESLRPGYSIKSIEELIPAALSEQLDVPWVLATIVPSQLSESAESVALHRKEPLIRPVQDRTLLLATLQEKLGASRKPSPKALLGELDFACSGVALRNSGRILGIRIAQTVIQRHRDTLLPSEYLPQSSLVVEQPLRPPAYILDEIRDSHREFIARVDSLASDLDASPASTGKVAREVYSFGRDLDSLRSGLSPAQNMVLSRILEQVARSEADGTLIPRFFTTADLFVSDDGELTEALVLTLQLFEHLGLIVPISVRTGNAEVSGYRLVTKEDLWVDRSIDDEVET